LHQNEFVIDEPVTPDTFDPGTAISVQGENIVSNADLPLIYFNRTGGTSSFVPVLAKSFTESADGKTYTFYLRNDVYYSNSDPFNAYVVWYNVYRNLYLNQPIDSPLYLSLNTTGVSVGDVNSFNNPQNDPTGNKTLLSIMENPHNAVTVTNSTVVEFHLFTPFVSFLQIMPAGPPWTMTDPYVVQQHGGVVPSTPNSWMAVNGSNIGDGPYLVKTYLPNQYVILIANPHYWAQSITDGNFMTRPGSIPTIIINYKTDELTRTLDIESGKVQATVVTYSDANNVLKAGTNLYVPNFGPAGFIDWLYLDTEKAPLNNALVRRAIVAAINVSEIRQVAYYNYLTPVVGPNLVGFFGYNQSITPPPYNLTEAKALLAQAGYPNGNGLPPLTFLYFTSATVSQIAAIIVANLAQIGITVKPDQVSNPTAIAVTGACCGNSTGFPDMAYGLWAYWPDFSGYEFLVDQQLGAFFYLNNATIHSLIIQSNSELNATKRAQEISKITIDVQQNAAAIWLGQEKGFPDDGGGIGPVIFNKCVTGDSNMWQNPYYWVFVGLDFNTIYYQC
jgi:peptide/nickel transport system substrate-binding protein